MRLKSNGFSLVELMVAVGVIGILSLAIMKLTENANKTSVQAKNADEINAFKNSINEVFSNPINCQLNLLGKKQGDSITGHLKSYVNGSSVNKFPIGQTSNKAVTISSVELEDFNINGSNGDKSSINLVITFNKPTNNLKIGGSQIKKRIPLHASFCPRLWLNGTSPESILSSCTGSRKKLIEGPHDFASSQYWGVCEDCSGIISSASEITSCNSMSSGAGVDIVNLSKLSCMNFGGTYFEDDQLCKIEGKSLVEHLQVNKQKLCDLEKETLILKREDANVDLCGKSYELKVKITTFNTPGPKSFVIPANYVKSSLVINLLGAGGAGGQGCSMYGEGGKRGQSSSVVASSTYKAGDTISGVVGNGGLGNLNGNGAFGNGDPGGNGGSTSVNLNGITVTAVGGEGGRASNVGRRGVRSDGEGVTFMNQWFRGGKYIPNQNGQPGQSGAGGAGAEHSSANCDQGGNGGHGILHFSWVEWREI